MRSDRLHASREGSGPAAAPAWVLGVLVATLTLATRLPALVNAAALNSDVAVVGLQARHLLQGEGSWFLWGSGYQTSVDAFFAALMFWVTGPTPLALVLTALLGHALLIGFVWLTLRGQLPAYGATVLVAPLVLSPSVINAFALYLPRQAALTLAFAGFWIIARSWQKRASAALPVGMAFAGIAAFADPYALIFVPVTGFLGAYAVWGDSASSGGERWRRLRNAAVGGLVGFVPLALLCTRPASRYGVTAMVLSRVPHNTRLLWDECLPWALSTRVFVPTAHVLKYEVWEPASWFRVVQVGGAVVFIAAIAYGVVAARRTTIPSAIRVLGAAGAAMFPITVAAFLPSVMVMDYFSTRYLVAFLLAAPFALTPLAYRVGPVAMACILAPFLLSSGVAGWMDFRPWTDGLNVTRDRHAPDAEQLEMMLRARGLTHATADYWVSYQLTFLFEENPVVVPIDPREDRYAPYRQQFQAVERFAYVFDPDRSREDFEQTCARFGETAAAVEHADAGRLKVVVFQRLATRN